MDFTSEEIRAAIAITCGYLSQEVDSGEICIHDAFGNHYRLSFKKAEKCLYTENLPDNVIPFTR